MANDRRDYPQRDRGWERRNEMGAEEGRPYDDRDRGPRDYRETTYGAGWAAGAMPFYPAFGTTGPGGYDPDYRGNRDDDWRWREEQRRAGRGAPYGNRYGEDRGFLDRASDEVASWFGDEDAERRREQDYRGYGPEGYTRSDARIEEDVNDRLTDDSWVDARGIAVTAEGGEVTLDGHVHSRAAKRRVEDCADSVSGVKHVQNNLRVRSRESEGETVAG